MFLSPRCPSQSGSLRLEAACSAVPRARPVGPGRQPPCPPASLSVTLSHQMGGGSEKSLGGWMVRQGMVRPPKSWGCPSGLSQCCCQREQEPQTQRREGPAGPTQHSGGPAPSTPVFSASWGSFLAAQASPPAAESSWERLLLLPLVLLGRPSYLCSGLPAPHGASGWRRAGVELAWLERDSPSSPGANWRLAS